MCLCPISVKLVPQGLIISLRHHKLTLGYDHSCLLYLQFVAASDRHVMGKVDMSDFASVVLRSSPLSIIHHTENGKVVPTSSWWRNQNT